MSRHASHDLSDAEDFEIVDKQKLVDAMNDLDKVSMDSGIEAVTPTTPGGRSVGHSSVFYDQDVEEPDITDRSGNVKKKNAKHRKSPKERPNEKQEMQGKEETSFQDTRLLLNMLLRAELRESKVAPYSWCGKFDATRSRLLTKHMKQSFLDEPSENLIWWLELCEIHADHPISYKFLHSIILKLTGALGTAKFSDTEMDLFCEAANKLIVKCCACIRDLKSMRTQHKAFNLDSLLSLVSELEKLQPIVGTESLRQNIIKELTQGAQDRANKLMAGISIAEMEDEVETLAREATIIDMSRIVGILHSDLESALENHEKCFLKTLNLSYVSIIYAASEEKVCKKVQQVMYATSKDLKSPVYREDLQEDPENMAAVSMGSALANLYTTLQKFVVLGKQVDSKAKYQVQDFYVWFHDAVYNWLEIALFKTLQRIQEAVKLDSLQPIHEYKNFSASVVNLLTCFNQMKTDWQEIGWPDLKSCYIFLEKILDNTRVCSEFYVERLKGKVKEHVLVTNPCAISPESCMLINNTEHLHRELQSYLDSLACNGARDDTKILDLQKCVVNINEETYLKYREAMKFVVNLICNGLKQPLLNCVENNGIKNVDNFMEQLQTNLCVLTKHLSEASVEQIVADIWSELLAAIDVLVRTGLEDLRLPVYFKNIDKTLKVLEGFFSQSNKSQLARNFENEPQLDVETDGKCEKLLNCIKSRLKLPAMEISQLVYEYYCVRLVEQDNQTPVEKDCSYVTLRLWFTQNKLHVHLENTWVKPKEKNGLYDLYMKINVLPTCKIHKYKTQTHKKTTAAILNETFEIVLTDEQIWHGNSLVHLELLDHKRRDMLGEAYVPFSSVQSGEKDPVSQRLPLTKPSSTAEYEALKELERRREERSFIKKEKAKLK